VAVEYPRKGVWALGLVTGEGIPDIEKLAEDPCISVMICTSPMPMAGFTINVRRSEAVDLNMTFDQAVQFIVSCGVIVPGRHALVVSDSSTEENPSITGHSVPPVDND
jgi:uncharacterized membrane protein